MEAWPVGAAPGSQEEQAGTEGFNNPDNGYRSQNVRHVHWTLWLVDNNPNTGAVGGRRITKFQASLDYIGTPSLKLKEKIFQYIQVYTEKLCKKPKPNH